jgi:flagellar basal-body rod protein FlgF
MDPIASAVASGLRARFESLDMLANNLANAGTRGFKADREFYSLYIAEEARAGDENTVTMPLIQRAWTDLSQGLLQPTENPLDVALNGKGFFAVDGPGGPLYTRNGSFQVSSAGYLETTDGYRVRSEAGRPIQVSPNAAVAIDKNGTVRQNGNEVARLAVVGFTNPDALQKYGLTYFSATPDAGVPSRPAGTEVRQGQLEAANVGTAESAVRLVSILRQFEALQKVLGVSSEMDRKVVEEVAKVSA